MHACPRGTVSTNTLTCTVWLRIAQGRRVNIHPMQHYLKKSIKVCADKWVLRYVYGIVMICKFAKLTSTINRWYTRTFIYIYMEQQDSILFSGWWCENRIIESTEWIAWTIQRDCIIHWQFKECNSLLRGICQLFSSKVCYTTYILFIV